jgi:hypothetical protein
MRGLQCLSFQLAQFPRELRRARHGGSWCCGASRAAHVLAGKLEFLKVSGNLNLGLPYTGGPLALPGVVTVLLARVLYGFSQGVWHCSIWDPWRKSSGLLPSSRWTALDEDRPFGCVPWSGALP